MLIGSKGWSQVVTGRWSLPVSPNGPWPPAVTKLQTQAGPPPMSFECQPHLTTLSSLRLPFQALFKHLSGGLFLLETTGTLAGQQPQHGAGNPIWSEKENLSFFKFCLETRKSSKGLRRAIQLAPLELKHR